jgi:D-beta-D-heptose 7-phosphate kinase/D-beta-D-heptose 1-phosphate adenosyltransferase
MDFSRATVLCVGDVMLDRFIHGDVERISPEAPVPVIRVSRTYEMLGGAGNVANNVASLGGYAILVGLLGHDVQGQCAQTLVDGTRGVRSQLILTRHRPTICKTRFIAANQQVVRADDESQMPLQPEEEAAIVQAVLDCLPQVQAVVLSDYGKSVLGGGVIARAIKAAREAGVPVFVDPKTDDFARYAGATCITPNLKELALASKMPVGDEDQVASAARRVMAQADAVAVLATRSEKGMMLVEASGSVHSVPSRARAVFDVSGAGDTVIASLALAHAAGRTLEQAMHISNAAAGVVVSKLGTATADITEVLHELADQDDHEHQQVLGLFTLPQLEAQVARWKAQGLAVGLTNGCFDIIHSGHISLLAAAKAQCDKLVVALNTDASVQRLKGPTRPINRLSNRAHVITSIRHVDCAVSFDEETPMDLIRSIMPDVLIKGADYTVEQVVGGDLVQAAGGRVYLAALMPGQSTTAIVGRAQLASTSST